MDTVIKCNVKVKGRDTEMEEVIVILSEEDPINFNLLCNLPPNSVSKVKHKPDLARREIAVPIDDHLPQTISPSIDHRLYL